MAGESWRKARPEDVERFHAAAAGIEGVEMRKMFGYPAAFVGGNMAAGLYQDTVMLRLPDDERQRRLDEGWSLFEVMPGRPMREYVALPADLFSDVDATRGWLERAAAYTRTLPPKAPKAPKASKAAKAQQGAPDSPPLVSRLESARQSAGSGLQGPMPRTRSTVMRVT